MSIPARFTQPNLPGGVAAGLLAGVVGAIVWGGFTALTHFRIGYLAIGIGVLVGYAIVRVGQVRTVAVGWTAAVITLVACAAGDTLSIYFQVSHELHLSVGTLLSDSNPITVFRVDVQHNAFVLVFFAIGAWAAFRYVARGGLTRSPRPVQVPPGQGYGSQPSYGRPSASAQPALPTYGQPVQPTYGQPVQPTYGQPVPPAYGQPIQPTYGLPLAPDSIDPQA